MNRLGIATLAFTAGMLFGYFAHAGFRPEMTPLQQCMDNASKRPTDMGVRVAINECHRAHSEERRTKLGSSPSKASNNSTVQKLIDIENSSEFKALTVEEQNQKRTSYYNSVIATSEEFKALSLEQKETVRAAFFESTILPHITPGQEGIARNIFNEATAIDARKPWEKYQNSRP